MSIAGGYTPQTTNGDGTTRTRAIAFVFLDPAHIAVSLWDTSALAAVAPAPVLNGGGTYDYTITGTPDAATGEYPGGTLTFNTAPPANYQDTIARVTPQTQQNSFPSNAKLPGPTIEANDDKLTLEVQELSYGLAQVTAPGVPALSRANRGAAYDSVGRLTMLGSTASQIDQAVAEVLAGTTPTSQAILVVASVAALRLNLLAFPVIDTLSYLAGGKKGGLRYYLDAADTTTADNGVAVLVDAGGRRYKPLPGTLLNQYHAGAKGGGVRATDAVLSTSGGARTITSAAKGFLGAVAGMTYIAQDAGAANTGGRPTPLIGIVQTAAADGSQITIDANVQRNLTAVTVCCGTPDDAAFDALMAAWGTYAAAVALVADKHLFTAKKQWGGGYSNKASTIRAIGRCLLMNATGNFTDDFITFSGFDQGNVQFSSGQRYYPVYVEDIEIECNNRGKAGVVTQNMTGSYIRARILNSHECAWSEMPTAGNWQERNTYAITAGRVGHHFIRRTNRGAGCFNNSNIYLAPECRGVGENSKLLGADITAGAATNQAGCAVYNYTAGDASTSDAGIDGHSCYSEEFDAERTTALANGSDTNPNVTVAMDATATTVLEGAAVAHVSNFYTGFHWYGGGTIEDITEGSDGRGGARFYGQPNTNCDGWFIAPYGAGPWASQSFLFSGTSNGSAIFDRFNTTVPKLRYNGTIDAKNDVTGANFTTRTVGRSGAVRGTIATSTTANVDIPLPPIFTGANRLTDFLTCTIKIWHLHSLDAGTPGAGVTETATYTGALLGDFDGTNFVTSNAKVLLASPGTYFSVNSVTIDYANSRVRCSLTTTAAWGAAGSQTNVYATVTFDGGINTLF